MEQKTNKLNRELTELRDTTQDDIIIDRKGDTYFSKILEKNKFQNIIIDTSKTKIEQYDSMEYINFYCKVIKLQTIEPEDKEQKITFSKNDVIYLSLPKKTFLKKLPENKRTALLFGQKLINVKFKILTRWDIKTTKFNVLDNKDNKTFLEPF